MCTFIELIRKLHAGVDALIDTLAVHNLFFEHRQGLYPHAHLRRFSRKGYICRSRVVIAEGIPCILAGSPVRTRSAVIADFQHPLGREYGFRQCAALQRIDLCCQRIGIQL